MRLASAALVMLCVLFLLAAQCGTTALSKCDESVNTGVACSDSTLCCSWLSTECGTCQCNGSTFECQTNTCSPTQGCPFKQTLVTGQACGPMKVGCGREWPAPPTCASTAPIYPCGAQCGCSAGAWVCNPNACPEAGGDTDAADDGATDATEEAFDAATE